MSNYFLERTGDVQEENMKSGQRRSRRDVSEKRRINKDEPHEHNTDQHFAQA